MTLVVAGTGHRPENCEEEEIVRLKSRVKLQYTPGISVFITGMAAGFDLWAADEARLLGIEVWAAKPWTGHQPRGSDRDLYDRVLDHASRVVNVTDVKDYPGKWVYPVRNHWMVDNADVVMAYWDGTESGGTYECYTYAKKKNKKIANIYHSPPF